MSICILFHFILLFLCKFVWGYLLTIKYWQCKENVNFFIYFIARLMCKGLLIFRQCKIVHYYFHYYNIYKYMKIMLKSYWFLLGFFFILINILLDFFFFLMTISVWISSLCVNNYFFFFREIQNVKTALWF